MRYTEILEACWTGYQQQGMKEKGDRMVPNCVPVSEQEMEEDLKKWFKEKWVRFGPDGKIRGACARGSEKEGKPKCLPQSKAHALGKKGRASAAAKKRREDPNPERRGPAKNVATKVKEDANPKFAGLIKNIQARLKKDDYQRPEIIKRVAQMVQQADPTVQDAMATARELVQQHGQGPVAKQTNVWDLKAQARSGNLAAQLPKTSAGTPSYAQQHATFEEQRTDDDDWYDDADEFGMPGSEFFPEKQPRGHYKVYYMTATDHKLMGRYATRDQAEQRVRELKADYPDNKFIVFASQRGMSEAQTDYQKRRQRERDVDAGRPVKPLPKNPKTDYQKKREKERQNIDEKQDACYRKVKSRYKVWPSAYASGALVQCRKKGAANWGTGGKKK